MVAIVKRETTIMMMLFSHDNSGRITYNKAYGDRFSYKPIANGYMKGLSVGSVVLFQCKYKQSINMIIRFLRNYENIVFHYKREGRILLVMMKYDLLAKEVSLKITKDKLWENKPITRINQFLATIGKHHLN